MTARGGFRARHAGVAACALVAMLAVPEPLAAQGEATHRPQAFIVSLDAEPLASYRGGVRGYAATAPVATGRRLDPTGFVARRYAALVDGVEQRVLAAAALDRARPFYRYRSALSGFAARLTPGEAQRLRAVPGVARVSPARRFRVTAAAPPAAGGGSELGAEAPAFLGLPEGLWARLGGPDQAGEGLVVGVVDTGIYPEHPSFASDPDDPPMYQGRHFVLPAHWQGRCQAGEQWAEANCNGKIVGARYFVEGYGRENLLPGDEASPRDTHGHGSHVAGIAAGNHGVDPRVASNDLGVGVISGLAPRAHLAVYKTAWGLGESWDTDVVAAVDAAVADGVDVINFSSGGLDSEPFGAVEMSLLAATEAGVFVSSVAGNEGPEGITGPGDAPWVTAAAESTLPRDFVTTVEVASARETIRLPGSTVSGALDPTGLVDGSGCEQETLDPAAVKGKAVLCRAGAAGGQPVDAVVAGAGGAGVVRQHDPGSGLLEAYARLVPTVEVSHRDGERIRSLLARAPGAEVSFAAGRAGPARGDIVSGYSSRGPQEDVPDILKPDLAAPGQEVLAAVSPMPAPPGYPAGLRFDAYSGTSMAAPHVAGAALLLRQAHPDWSPAAIRSALMTTAVTRLRTVGGAAADPFARGAGRIDPNQAVEPGLILDVSGGAYRGVVEGIAPEAVTGDTAAVAPVDLNLPSVSVSALAGTATTRRTVTSVASAPARWTARVEGLAGVAASVSPAGFELAPGASEALTLDLRVEGEATGRYTFGAVVLSRDGGADIGLPVAVRPVAVAAPALVAVPAAEGSGRHPVEVQAGFEGVLSAAASRLAAPQVHSGQPIGRFDGTSSRPEPGPGVAVHDLEVKGPAELLRGEITGADGGDTTTDLDLFLFFDDEGDGIDPGDLIGASVAGGWAESIAVPSPSRGRYRFVVLGYATRPPVTVYDFATWVVEPQAPGDPPPGPGLTVSGGPARVARGDRVQLGVEWTGLGVAAAAYYGVVSYHRGEQPGSAPAAVSVIRIVRVVRSGPAP